jgi:hypothetical protein
VGGRLRCKLEPPGIPHRAAQSPTMRASTATFHSVIRSRTVPHRGRWRPGGWADPCTLPPVSYYPHPLLSYAPTTSRTMSFQATFIAAGTPGVSKRAMTSLVKMLRHLFPEPKDSDARGDALVHDRTQRLTKDHRREAES